MSYVKYNRTFVMLEEQTREFATKDAPVKGYLKVETGNNKGALRCVVQNLRYYDRGDYIYKLILFGKKHEETIHASLGGLILNRSGNGETYFRFNPVDVDGKGNGYHDFSTAIVAAASGLNRKESLHPVLKGTMRAENNNPSAGIDENSNCDSIYTPGDDAVKKPPQNDCPGPSAAVSSPSGKRVCFNSFYNESLLEFCGCICHEADVYEELTPFDQDLTGARWKKVLNSEDMPMASPGARYFSKMYKHFLFGAKAGENGYAEEFYIAVPGRFSKEEQPDGGRSGFVYWQPVTGAEKDSSSYGYWIAAIDAKNGDILEVLP